MAMDLWEPDEPDSSLESERSTLRIRRLGEQDQTRMEALFATSPGYSLFLSENLAYLHSGMDLVRYWGAYSERHLAAVLMMVGHRAIMYAEPGVDISALARVATEQQVDFIMGQPAGIDAVLQLFAGGRLTLRQEHILAEYALPKDRTPRVALPPGALVRRAHLGDLGALTSLYYRTDGFESLGKDQLRRTMHSRIRTLRTWIAEADGRIVSAASTSAETGDAAMIGGVWTAPALRKRGFSTAVVSALSRELAEEGRRPYLFYLTDNVAAAHVYLRVGYSPIGRWSLAHLAPPDPSE